VTSQSNLWLVGGLHKNGLHLPRPRLFDHARKTESYRDVSVLNEQRHWSHPPHLSDSDGEENVLEADRDARLAYECSTALSYG
jgi:hypothetical protein